MTSLKRQLYSPRLFDAVFAATAIGGIAVMLRLAGHGSAAIEAASDPLRKGAAAVGALIAAAVLAAASARLDQALADDFVFQTLAKAAMIGLVTFMIFTVLWQSLFADTLGELPSVLTLPLVLTSWALAYFYTRVRGTGA